MGCHKIFTELMNTVGKHRGSSISSKPVMNPIVDIPEMGGASFHACVAELVLECSV